MKIAIIGYGAATIGFLWKLLQLDKSILQELHIHIYDQNKYQNAGGLGGLAYDGKLIMGQYSGSDDLIELSIQQEIFKFFISHSQLNDVTILNEQCNNRNNHQKISLGFYNKELYLVPQFTKHLGTDQLKETNINILKYFKDIIDENHYDINFLFDTKIRSKDIDKLQKQYDKVIFAVGRYGTSLLNYFKQKKQYVQSNNKIDIGVRFQIPSYLENINNLNRIFYEWKIRYKTKNNLFVRTFCHNPDGFVVVQHVDVLNNNITIVNGHAKKNDKSYNTNFAILVTQQFTEPFSDSVLFGKSISQQANLLAGSNSKVILQTLGDFKNKKRTKKLFRVIPTLQNNSYILGDLSYVFPAKTYDAIIQFIDRLSQIIPEVNNSDNLLYGVQVKFYNMKMKNSQNLYWIGDCSGKSRSIISAASTGYLLVEQLFGEK